jgi:hypothetical protein
LTGANNSLILTTPKIITIKEISMRYTILAISAFIVTLSQSAFADDHATAGADVVAMQAHYCSLKNGKDMADVNKALGPWRKWKEQNNYNAWTIELTPQYDISEGYDFYWLNFLPFDDMAAVLDSYANTGASAQNAIDSVANCKVALYASKLKYPLVDESNLAETSVVNIDSCNKRDDVDMRTLMERHDEFVATSMATKADYLWNVVWPMAGVPAEAANGEVRTDFANMFWFPNLTSQMTAFNSEVNGELQALRRTYLQSFAHCTDRNTYNVKVLNKPNSAWN